MASQYKGYGFLNVDVINNKNNTNDNATATTKLVGTFYVNDSDGEIIHQFTITK